MVAWILTAAVTLLAVASVSAAPGRQLCLTCHPVHHARLGSCTACHRGNPDSGRRNIAHQRLIAGRYARFTLADDQQLRKGARLLEQYACRRCHVIGGRGNHLAADLGLAAIRRSPEEMEASIRRPVLNMPDFRMEEEQAESAVNALLSAAARLPAPSAARPQVVHFDQPGAAGKDVFSVKCGPCHRMLTAGLGGLGRGDAGPNLSGLLTAFYPATFRDRQAWNPERLRRWLENPRVIRAGARMLPVKLSETEFRDLLEILRVAGTD